jgi:hypothetical protein
MVFSAARQQQRLFPSAGAVLTDYMVLGARHILDGPDHLLFLLVVLATGMGWAALVITLSAFTLGHATTLALGVLGQWRVSPTLAEPAIALTIVLMALLDERARRRGVTIPLVQRMALVFACALVHGLGFAAAVSLAANVPHELHWHVLQAARARWASRMLGPFLDTTRSWMAPYYQALEPHEQAIIAAAADGRLCLGYTRVAWTRRWPPARAGHSVLCCFSSLRAFVYCITVSQRCVPFYRSPGWLHGGWGLDGAFSAQFTLPPGCDAARCVTVSPTNPLADVAPAEPVPPHWFLTLPDAARWERLRQMGFDAARAKHDLMLARGFVAKPAAHERERETAAVSAIRL